MFIFDTQNCNCFMKLKNKIISLFQFISPVLHIRLLQRVASQIVVFPFYHCINDLAPVHVKHLFVVRNEKTFRNDLDFFMQHYKLLDFNDLLSGKDLNRTSRKQRFYMTFDDGLSEIYTIVAPILKSKGIHATFFINPDFVDNKSIFYRFKASILIEKNKTNSFTAATINEINRIFRQYSIYEKNIHKALLQVSYSNKKILNKLALLFEIDFNEYLVKKNPYLTSTQIQSLISDGFSIGSHSLDHPEFRFITEKKQIQQITRSIEYLHNSFGITKKLFSFPFTDFGISDELFKALHNQKITDVTFGCAGLKKSYYPFHYQRIPMEISSLPASRIIKAEYLYNLLAKSYNFKKRLF